MKLRPDSGRLRGIVDRLRPSRLFKSATSEPVRRYLRDDAFVRACEQLEVFDSVHYAEESQLPNGSFRELLEHYLEEGAARGLNPSPAFDTRYYLSTNPDVVAARVNPLYHYVVHGRREGRRPTPNHTTESPRLDAASTPAQGLGEHLDIAWHTFGDYSKASSRLRAFKLAEHLKSLGHRVHLNPGGGAAQIHVFQKVRPFEAVRRARRAGATIVYDFDDHYLLDDQGVADEVVAMMNSADVVTVGNRLLLDAARAFHRNVHLLENPVDIISAATRRPKRRALDRLGWFGAPEGLRQLRLVDVDEPITTITRGGDIEFDIQTVDETLTRFDILVFPLEMTEWNMAKNANRMIKAVALSVPVLASQTPEHERVAQQLGLDERFLVRVGESWREKVEALRAQAAVAQATIERARAAALELYATSRIADAWLEDVRAAQGPRYTYASIARRAPVAREERGLRDVAVVTWDYEGDRDFTRTRTSSEVPWTAFGSRYVISPSGRGNAFVEGDDFEHEPLGGDYLAIFERIDSAVSRVEEEWMLLLPGGYFTSVALEGRLRDALDDVSSDTHLIFLRSQSQWSPPDERAPRAYELADWLFAPREPGAMVVRRTWLHAQSLKSSKLATYWCWWLAARALSQNVATSIDVPVVLRSRPLAIPSLSELYKSWLSVTEPELIAELPSMTNQWDRIRTDVLTEVVRDFSEVLPELYARGITRRGALESQVERLRRELARAKVADSRSGAK